MNKKFNSSHVDDFEIEESIYTNKDLDDFEDETIDDMEDDEMDEVNPDSKTLTPIKAIRAKCMDCCCYQRNEVAACPCTNCALWPYRFGKRPVVEGQEKKKRVLTDEQKAKLAENVKKAQEARRKKKEEMGK